MRVREYITACWGSTWQMIRRISNVHWTEKKSRANAKKILLNMIEFRLSRNESLVFDTRRLPILKRLIISSNKT